MITGRTKLIVHLGYPTESFKAPMIYNPWFEMKGIEAVVVPVGVEPPNYPDVLKALFRTTNVHGALVTMPHKVTTTHLVNEMTTTAKIAGACNAILRRPDGSLLGDMFDGAGFVARRGTQGKADRRRARAWSSAAAVSARRSRPHWRRRGFGDRAVRSGTGHREALGRPVTATLSRIAGDHRIQRSHGLRHRGQRHAARHEARAIRCRWTSPGSRQTRSSAKSS